MTHHRWRLIAGVGLVAGLSGACGHPADSAPRSMGADPTETTTATPPGHCQPAWNEVTAIWSAMTMDGQLGWMEAPSHTTLDVLMAFEDTYTALPSECTSPRIREQLAPGVDRWCRSDGDVFCAPPPGYNPTGAPTDEWECGEHPSSRTRCERKNR